MKRKFTNGLLALAVMIASAASLVSCKDYEEDRFQELQAEVQKDANLRTALQAQVDALSTLLTQLQAQQALCEQNCSTMQASLANYLTKAEAAGLYLTKTQADGYYVSQAAYDAKVAEFVAQINTLNTEIANLKAQDNLLETQITTLQTDLADAKTALNTKIDTEIANLKALLQGDMNALKAELDGKITNTNTRIDAINSTIATIQSNVATLTGQVSTLQTDMTDALARLTAVEALAAEAKKIANQAAANATQALNDAAAAKTAADNAKAAADAAAAAASAADTKAQEAATKAQEAKTKADAAYDLANTANTAATTAQNLANENKGKIDNLTTTLTTSLATINTAISTMDGRIDGLDSRITSEVATINSTITGITNRIDALEAAQKIVDGMQDHRIDSLAFEAGLTKALAEANKTEINSMKTTLTEIQNKLSKLDATDSKLKYSIDSLANITKNLYSNAHIDSIAARVEEVYTLTHNYADTVKQFVIDSMNHRIDSIKNVVINELKTADKLTNARIDSLNKALNPQLSDLAAGYKKGDSLLNARIDTLNKELNEKIKPQIAQNTKDIQKLTNTFNDVMAKFITSVVLQGTRNDVIGYGALPIGVRSLVLAAYYGQNKTGANYTFPTTPAALMINAYNDPHAQTLTSGDIKMLNLTGVQNKTAINDGDVLLVDTVGNAGTLYLTVNPNTVDFTGTSFTLENSIQQKSGVQLGDLTPSNYKLSFGYVRGAAANGFYEAKATVKKSDIEGIKPRINVQDLKDVASDLRSWNTNISLNKLGNTFYNSISDILDANAVKASWTDSLGAHSVYSEYGIAATAIKPLSQGFMYGKTYSRVPGLGRLERFVDKMIDQIKVRNKYDKMLDIDNVEINTIDRKADGSVVANVTVAIDEVVYATDGVTPIGTVSSNKTYDVDITDEVNDLLDEYNGKLTEVANDINSIISQLRAFNIQQMVTDVKTDIKNNLHKYFDKVNTKLSRFMTPNDAVAPLLLIQNGDNWARLSSVKNMPTRVSANSFQLLPTSFTAEFLAPAYKKFVAVTNVYNEDYSKSAQDDVASLQNALKAVNKGDLNKVWNGGRLLINANGFQKNFIYEIAYATVDYDGKVYVKKFYVKLK